MLGQPDGFEAKLFADDRLLGQIRIQTFRRVFLRPRNM